MAETYHRSQQSSAETAHFTSTVYTGAIGARTTGSSGTSTAANRKTGIAAVPVRHPQLDDALWLVVSRPGRGRKPWYLLTNEPIATTDDAWRVVLAYARRWQVEMCYRACKTDLQDGPGHGESPALVLGKPVEAAAHGQPGLRFPALLAGAKPRPLGPGTAPALVPQNGRAIPLSRLRAALSALWLTHPPS